MQKEQGELSIEEDEKEAGNENPEHKKINDDERKDGVSDRSQLTEGGDLKTHQNSPVDTFGCQGSQEIETPLVGNAQALRNFNPGTAAIPWFVIPSHEQHYHQHQQEVLSRAQQYHQFGPNMSWPGYTQQQQQQVYLTSHTSVPPQIMMPAGPIPQFYSHAGPPPLLYHPGHTQQQSYQIYPNVGHPRTQPHSPNFHDSASTNQNHPAVAALLGLSGSNLSKEQQQMLQDQHILQEQHYMQQQQQHYIQQQFLLQQQQQQQELPQHDYWRLVNSADPNSTYRSSPGGRRIPSTSTDHDSSGIDDQSPSINTIRDQQYLSQWPVSLPKPKAAVPQYRYPFIEKLQSLLRDPDAQGIIEW
eukprot:CAMPEP_0197314048 /NCGR_PEP_ID=MMETSP0891-20130614/31858_1 /TAXON_ID=44058 ORGANISM="Aureoumbra lagunensis, Strain CCMP1510" /NCGR_SAMPLE_ID=MMETSP0891 /ASSEMBLY_ACC=CAM_ASM_000534 /LENGTH=357 /DNA_ID=CAMNT_0042802287 /DNA_START=46 /DNA_END=1116 /DNA_ORIENTATION=-